MKNAELGFYMTDEGIDITPEGTMDSSLQTAVYHSIFAPSSWWGNAYAADEEKIEAKFDDLINKNPVLTNGARLNAVQYITDALAWLKNIGAKSVEVSATIPAVNQLYVTIDIYGPDEKMLPALRYGVNWQNQEVYKW